MVAYTSPDCLPYFECSDLTCINTGSTCDPSSVWCDQARLIEAKLDEFDAVVDRTATTVPMVLVQLDGPFQVGVTLATYFPTFTEVVVDTDDMANLDTNPFGYNVTRSGLYEMVAYGFGAAANPGATITVNMTLRLDPPSPPINGITRNFVSTSYDVNITNSQVTPQIHFVLPLYAGQIVTMSFSMGGSTGDVVNFTYLMMGATWMADIP